MAIVPAESLLPGITPAVTKRPVQVQADIKLLTVKEVQECLSLSRTRTYALISSGELPHVRIGRSEGKSMKRPGLPEGATCTDPQASSFLRPLELQVLIPAAELRRLTAADQPILVSQRNCELLALNRRDFLEALRRPDFSPTVMKIGKLRLVRVSEFLDWLGNVAKAQQAIEQSEDEATEVLREVLGHDVTEIRRTAE